MTSQARKPGLKMKVLSLSFALKADKGARTKREGESRSNSNQARGTAATTNRPSVRKGLQSKQKFAIP